VGGLFRRCKAKPKTGRPRHQKADSQEREAFKKSAEHLGLATEHEAREQQSSEQPLKVLAFDEARFELLNWNKRRYCPKGFRPPSIVSRRYEWTYHLYVEVEPTTAKSVCAYLPRVDARCLEAFLEHLGKKKYADHRVILVLDNAPSHLSKAVVLPENVSLLKLPPYSPELNPVERCFQEFRRELSSKIFEDIDSLQAALSVGLEPYRRERERLRNLTGFPWWRAAADAL
jgi:transposase